MLTFNDRKDFVVNISRLSLLYTKQHNQTSYSFTEFLSKYTPLYRLTIFWDGIHHPAVDGFNKKDQCWIDICTKIENKQVNEDFLWQYLEPAIDRDINNWPWIPDGYVPYKLPDDPVGFFAFEPQDKNLGLHLANIFVPESPFTDIYKRKQELLQVIETAWKKYGKSFDTIGCSSWLNSYDVFLSIFPDLPSEVSSCCSNIGYGFDVWGQFINKRGAYHKPNGDFLLSTGKFKYNSVGRYWDIKEIYKDLKKQLY